MRIGHRLPLRAAAAAFLLTLLPGCPVSSSSPLPSWYENLKALGAAPPRADFKILFAASPGAAAEATPADASCAASYVACGSPGADARPALVCDSGAVDGRLGSNATAALRACPAAGCAARMRSDGCSFPPEVDALVADGAAVRRFFEASCEQHDACYAAPGRRRADCDGEFLHNMRQQCLDLPAGAAAASGQAARQTCAVVASAIGAAVVGWGQESFNHDRNLCASLAS